MADFVASQYIDEFVERHVVIGYYNSGVLSNGQSLSAMNGQSVDIEISDDGVTASGSTVGTPDILAYNGVVHSLDEVLPFDIPAASGTCGTWTLELYVSDINQNWLGSTVDVFKNGIMIAEETNNEIAEDNKVKKISTLMTIWGNRPARERKESVKDENIEKTKIFINSAFYKNLVEKLSVFLSKLLILNKV
mgnify:CR=1 FL=1